MSTQYKISLQNLLPDQKKNFFSKSLCRIFDHILGVNSIERAYKGHRGLDRFDFVREFLHSFDVEAVDLENWTQQIPEKGPVIFACNHPFGGIEGVALAHLISQKRPDLKILANQGLKVFKELEDFFIFTNPLKTKNIKNVSSLRQCIKHVKNDKALLIFPAGKVAYYQTSKGRISEHPWNPIIEKLVRSNNVHYFPLFLSGKNSSLFYNLGRIHNSLRLLRLPRELLNKRSSKLLISSGSPLRSTDFKPSPMKNESAKLCRNLSYVQDPSWNPQWPKEEQITVKPLVQSPYKDEVWKELSQLPADRRLYDHREFSLFYGDYNEIPKTVGDIGYQREATFRKLKEGNGGLSDTDIYDKSYSHLVLFDNEAKTIAGSYRFGRSDLLTPGKGQSAMYLSGMFDFKENFCFNHEPCLEMGRSFISPKYQKNVLGLYLLWRGIGEFLKKHPYYRTLYGTVSISRLYSPRSIAVMKRALVPKGSPLVSPLCNLDTEIPLELEEFACQFPLANHLETFVKTIEPDGKGLPILLKHYMGLGAQFHAMGVDENFRHTPGILLTTSIPNVSENKLKRYLGSGYLEYKNYSATRLSRPVERVQTL